MQAVTFVTQFFDPDPSATAYYLSDVAYGLAARGVAVTVITAQPSYEEGLATCPSLERRRGVLIHRVAVAEYERSATLPRLKAQLGFTAAAGRLLRRQSEKSLVVAVTCPPFLTWLGYLCALLKRRFVPLIHDVYPQIAVALDKFPARVAPLWETIERGALATSSAVWVLGRCQAEVTRPRLPPRLQSSIVTIPHWAKSQIEMRPGHARFRHPLLQAMKLETQFVVQYSGNLGLFHGLDILPDVIEQSDPATVHFLIVGGGQKKGWLQKEVKRRKLRHVTFLPHQPESEFANVLSACDAGFVCLHPAATGLCVPSKLYGILASGRPVIAVTSKSAEPARVVREFNCGVVVDTHDASEVAAAIRTLAQNPSHAAELGRNAQSAYQGHFTQEHGLNAYEAALSNLMG